MPIPFIVGVKSNQTGPAGVENAGTGDVAARHARPAAWFPEKRTRAHLGPSERGRERARRVLKQLIG